MIKIKSLLYCVLLLFVCTCSYAQGEAAGNDWAAMGLKGKVKSVKTSIYFAEEKDNDFTKGSPFSQGIYPPEKIKQYSLQLPDKAVTLSLDDVEISTQDIEGWLVATAGSLLVALDIHITPELRQEGIARELVNRIQNIRKDNEYDITDRIQIRLQAQPALQAAVTANEAYIKNETLTDNITFVDNLTEGEEIAFDEVTTRIVVSR